MTLHAQTLRLAARQFRAFNREALTAELAVPAHRHEGGWVSFRRTGSSNRPRAWEGRSSRDATTTRYGGCTGVAARIVSVDGRGPSVGGESGELSALGLPPSSEPDPRPAS